MIESVEDVLRDLVGGAIISDVEIEEHAERVRVAVNADLFRRTGELRGRANELENDALDLRATAERLRLEHETSAALAVEMMAVVDRMQDDLGPLYVSPAGRPVLRTSAQLLRMYLYLINPALAPDGPTSVIRAVCDPTAGP